MIDYTFPEKAKKLLDMLTECEAKLEKSSQEANAALDFLETEKFKEDAKIEEIKGELALLEEKNKQRSEEIERIKENLKNEREKGFEGPEAYRQEIIRNLAKDPNGIGICIGLIGQKMMQIKCPICFECTSDDNKLVFDCPENHLACTRCSDLKEVCIKCGNTKDVKSFDEGDVILKEIRVYKGILSEVKKCKLPSVDSDSKTLEATEDRIAELETLLSTKDKESQEYSLRNKELEEEMQAKEAIIADQKDTIAALTTKLQNISESKERMEHELGKIKNNSASLQRISESNRGSKAITHTYNTKGTTKCEIKIIEQEAEIELKQRDLEREDFLFWIGKYQMCGKLEKTKWKLTLWEGKNKLDSCLVAGKCPNWDTFFRIEDRIYLSVHSTLEFYKIEVKAGKFALQLIEKRNSRMLSVVEWGNALLVANNNKEIQKIEGKTVTTITIIDKNVWDLKVKGDTLFLVDTDGQAATVNLTSGVIQNEFNFKEYGLNFMFDDKVVINTRSKVKIYDWNGTLLIEHPNVIGDWLRILHQNEYFTVITAKNGLYVLNHETLHLKHYNTEEIPRYYSR